MAHYTEWHINAILARIEHGQSASPDLIADIKISFENNGVPNLGSKEMIEFMSLFNFDDPLIFSSRFNALKNAKTDLASMINKPK